MIAKDLSDARIIKSACRDVAGASLRPTYIMWRAEKKAHTATSTQQIWFGW